MLIKYNEIFLGNKCNNNCIFCPYRHEERKYFKSIDDIKKEIASIKEKTNICFYGGEPTIHENLIELVEYAKSLGFERIKLKTNARMLAYKDFTKRLIDSGVWIYEIKFPSHNEDVFNKVTQTESFDQVVKGIENLRHFNKFDEKPFSAFICIEILVLKGNYDNLIETIDFLLGHKINRILLNLNFLNIEFKEVKEELSKAITFSIQNNLWISCLGVPICLLKGYEEHVSEIYNEYKKNYKLEECKECIFYEVCIGFSESSKKYFEKSIKPIKNHERFEDIINLKKEI